VVYHNGRYEPEHEARISIYDSALTCGDMAFEVTRTVHGRPFRLAEHLRRLAATMSALRIEAGLSANELEAITHETLARNLATEDAEVDWQIVHNVSRGPVSGYRRAFRPDELRPTVLVSCYPLVEKLGRLAPAYDSGLEAVVPSQRSIPGHLLDPHLKTRSRLHYQLANLQAEALRPGAVALLLDERGCLTEATSGNVFAVVGGHVWTPVADGVLPGVTRSLVLDLASELGLEPREADLSHADARHAEELFVTSTSIGLLHVRSLDGSALGDGRLGPVTARLRQALHEAIGLDVAVQARAYAARLSPA
jgi:branched-chain amino acid aminotransferase